MYLLKATSATFSSFRSQHIPGRVDKMRFNQHNKSSVFTLLMSFCVFFFASSVPIMEQHLLWKVSQDVTGATLFHQTFSSITSNQINVWCWKGHQLWSKWHTNQTICLVELCKNNWHERVCPNLDLGVNLSRRNQAISKKKIGRQTLWRMNVFCFATIFECVICPWPCIMWIIERTSKVRDLTTRCHSLCLVTASTLVSPQSFTSLGAKLRWGRNSRKLLGSARVKSYCLVIYFISINITEYGGVSCYHDPRFSLPVPVEGSTSSYSRGRLVVPVHAPT